MAETLFHCDDILWARFVALCRDRDETPGAVLRDLVRLEVKRCVRRKARSAEGIDERLLVRLRLLVAEALAGSESWGQLQSALRERGLRYVPAGGGLGPDRSRNGPDLGQGEPGRPRLPHARPRLRHRLSRPSSTRNCRPGAGPPLIQPMTRATAKSLGRVSRPCRPRHLRPTLSATQTERPRRCAP